MADRVCNISDIIHRVASSCLTQPLAGAVTRRFINGDDDEEQREEIDSDKGLGIWEEKEEEDEHRGTAMEVLEKLGDMETFMIEVFNAVSAVKKAYVGLQEAHCPWDPDRIRVADTAVVAELRKLVRLRDRFRRGVSGCGSGCGGGRAPIREVVAPYEAALVDLRREIKAKDAEIENLKEKLVRSGRAGRNHSSKRVGCISGLEFSISAGSSAVPTPELFENCMDQVKSASRSFTTHLLSLMRAARWDLAAVAHSIIDGSGDSPTGDHPPLSYIPGVEPRHARYALEAYVNRKLFHGFENETFYLEGSLTSLLRPAEFRRDCFSQFRDMHAMEPAELLGILPTCHFGRFAGKKYLAVVHPKMEDSLFGGSEQRRAVIAGGHPRTGFYGEFLRLAKAVWLLHLLAFALDPAPSHFEASKGAEFHEEYMESVAKFTGGKPVPEGAVVGFSVAPGFKLGNWSVVRARVFVVPEKSLASAR